MLGYHLFLSRSSPPPSCLRADSVPSLCSFYFSSLSSQCFSSLPFLDWFPSLIFPLPFHSLLVPHPVLSIRTCTNIDLFFFAWLVVLLEPLCQQQRSFKELFMLRQTRNKHHTGLHGGSQMDTYILVSIKKGLLKLVMTVGF